jgi:hypothetical protein
MKTVWKFSLTFDGTTVFNKPLPYTQDVSMPEGAQILTVQMQDDTPTIWVLVNPSADPDTRKFMLVDTGFNEVPPDAAYIGTFQKGWFVGHVFEVFF